MTFADLIYKVWQAASAHRTKLVGVATAALGYVASQPGVPEHVVSACTMGAGLLTILCGVANTSAIAAKIQSHSTETGAQK